jgi:hypothetical protein
VTFKCSHNLVEESCYCSHIPPFWRLEIIEHVNRMYSAIDFVTVLCTDPANPDSYFQLVKLGCRLHFSAIVGFF